jgi:hypothetical protein
VHARTLALVPALAILLTASFVPVLAGTGTPAFANWSVPGNLAQDAGEPSIGVDPATDIAYFQAFTNTYAVHFNAAGTPTWTDVTAPTSLINLDPILFTDRATHRTFAGGLGPECSLMQYTDTSGQLWVPMGNACPFPASDHPSIGGGPWHNPPPIGSGIVYANGVYLCQQSGQDVCVTSMDGGITFGLPVSIQGCSSFHGHIKVSADGTVYVPSAYCGSHQGGFASTTNGASYVAYTIPGSNVQSNGGGFDPSVATTPDNTVYESWTQGSNNHPMVARSTTHGATWDRVTDLALTTSPNMVAGTFVAATAGDNGRVAVAYLASVDGNSANPYTGNFHGTWDLYVSYTYDAGQTWTTVKATSDPVQRGCIYDVVSSPSCHRNLLDFMDATVDAEGRVLVAYADGCTSSTCIAAGGSEASSNNDLGTIARQVVGTGLYAAFDGP